MKVIDCRIMARHEALYWLYFLRAYRKAHGYTIEQLARRSGVSTTTIGRLEREQQPARLATIGKLAKAAARGAAIAGRSRAAGCVAIMAIFRDSVKTHERVVSGGIAENRLEFRKREHKRSGARSCFN